MVSDEQLTVYTHSGQLQVVWKMCDEYLKDKHIWLVVSPHMKNMKVNWDDEIPN